LISVVGKHFFSPELSMKVQWYISEQFLLPVE